MITLDAAVKYFGSKSALARALGIKKQAITVWKDHIPQRRQYELEYLTNGALKATKPKRSRRPRS